MDSSIEKQAVQQHLAEPADSVDKQLSVEDRGDVVEGTYTPEEERVVLRKIDCTILPMMCFVFFMQYLDKQSLSYASVCHYYFLVYHLRL